MNPTCTPADDATHAPTVSDRWRPAAHFTARRSWLNDPNGLLHHDGVYHLFFQTNPDGSTWGDISWGHATSTDLLTWTEHDIAIPRTADELVFSGSAVADVHNTAGLAAPGQTALVAIYTAVRPARADRPGSQAQALAYSVDGGRSWERYAGNPVLDIGSEEFRDPKVFWYGGPDGHWVMVVAEAVDRRVAVYTSPNLIEWTFESRFGPAHAVGGVWECPDLFPLTVRGTDRTRWVLVVSLNPGGIAGGTGTQYFVGDFDGRTFTPERLSLSQDPRDLDWLDHGRDYYAAVSFNDAPDGRRLTIGWASNWDYAAHTPTGPWRSAMSLARELDLVRAVDGRHRVAQRPVLPDDPRVTVVDLTVASGAGERTEVVLSTGEPGGSELVLTVDGDARTLTCDRTRSGDVGFHPAFASVETAPLPPGDATTTDLRIVVDACVVEIYVDGGQVTLTALVFPDAPLVAVRVLPSRAR
ncbi:glycoside hydrolase family 32 protein [Cellulomonas soli]|uniref:Levanase n=1 Tax=Cellulomonas soli TaxID=931535 RepID=A0A512PDK3_9CELL|nr:glycoside hydrolase family 32 protein [Cellulomonas soli]NYI60068.1 sucrose-6-phosphate hydrolase SacC (GH32 family) [Cellulomonas soli]GEP69278.1 levanase [Cellulomonas soli]